MGLKFFKIHSNTSKLKETFSIMTNRNQNQNQSGSAHQLLLCSTSRTSGKSSCDLKVQIRASGVPSEVNCDGSSTAGLIPKCKATPALCIGAICRGSWWELQRPPDLCCADSLVLLCLEWPPGSNGIERFLLDDTSKLEPHVFLGLSDVASS